MPETVSIMSKKTAVVRDIRYLRHGADYMEPETPKRLKAVYAMLDQADMKGRFIEISPTLADIDYLMQFHDAGYVETICGTASMKRCVLDPDTETTEDTYDTARLAAGGVMKAIDAVISGSCDNAFALVRPPGHHADAARAAGFCIFNNVVLGAMHAVARHGLKRILICDWDMHHGNGTQDAFYADRRVLYFSTHQSPAYPGTGLIDEIGSGNAIGYNINVPLRRGAGDAHYADIYKRILEPVAQAFKPELVLLSAGFDIHHQDPLGGMRVTERGFAAMTRILMNIAEECCDGRFVAVLEGGYDLAGLSASIKSVLNEMRDDTHLSDAEIDEIRMGAADKQYPAVQKVIMKLKQYWPV